MTKNQVFAINMRAMGYRGTDAQFRELARLLRMTVRLGIAANDFPTNLVREIWSGMLSPITVAA